MFEVLNKILFLRFNCRHKFLTIGKYPHFVTLLVRYVLTTFPTVSGTTFFFLAERSQGSPTDSLSAFDCVNEEEWLTHMQEMQWMWEEDGQIRWKL